MTSSNEQDPRQIQRGRTACTVLAPSSHVARLGPVLLLVVAVSPWASCSAPPRPSLGRPPTPEELTELWEEPPRARDTFLGSGGAALAPRADVVYRLVERKIGGFSPKLEVRDPSGVKWSVKLGDEAQPEVTSSRILWGVGYRQPPDYYLRQWQVGDEAGVHPMGPARFRPHVPFIKTRGDWAWHSNPFVDSVPFRGLLVLLMVLNSTDLTDENNEVYDVREPGHRRETWYTVKDLGASLGETGWIHPRRNDIGLFESEGFITGVEDGYVRFAFRGHFKELVSAIRAADVQWMCGRLKALSPAQWREAFRAGGYDEVTTARYLRKIDEKIAQGLSLGTEMAR